MIKTLNARRALAVAAVAIIMGAGVGCESSQAPPNGITRTTGAGVELAVVTEPANGGPSTPVTIRIIVRNGLTQEVWHCDGCGCGNGAILVVTGPDGKAVALTDPNAPQPLCPDAYVTLASGAELQNASSFDGNLYEPDASAFPSPTYPAPAGVYTVSGRFPYGLNSSGGGTEVTGATSFTWNP